MTLMKHSDNHSQVPFKTNLPHTKQSTWKNIPQINLPAPSLLKFNDNTIITDCYEFTITIGHISYCSGCPHRNCFSLNSISRHQKIFIFFILIIVCRKRYHKFIIPIGDTVHTVVQIFFCCPGFSIVSGSYNYAGLFKILILILSNGNKC
jgi:hypothetical protein